MRLLVVGGVFVVAAVVIAAFLTVHPRPPKEPIARPVTEAPKKQAEPPWPTNDAVPASASGQVSIIVRGGAATLFVDGQRRGRVRKQRTLELAAGKHVIEVRGGSSRAKKTIRVDANSSQDIEVDVKRGKVSFH